MRTLHKLTLITTLLLSSLLSAFAQPSVNKTTKIGAVGLYEIVFNPTENVVYVATIGPRRQNQAKILKLDPKTLQVQGSIDVGAEAAYGLGLNNKTQTLYTSNTTAGSVSAIDLKTGKITVIKKEGETPHFREIAVDEDTNTVYVSIAGRENSAIWVIDGNKNTLSRVIENTGRTTTGIAIDKTDNRLFVTNMGDQKIAVIDPVFGNVVDQFESGGEDPINLVFDAKTHRLFVANQKSGDVTVLDSKTGKLLKTIKTGEGALGINFNPASNRIYVANRVAGTVTVIDAATYEILADLPAGTYPNTIAIDTHRNVAYVTNKAKRMPEGEVDAAGDTVSLIVP